MASHLSLQRAQSIVTKLSRTKKSALVEALLGQLNQTLKESNDLGNFFAKMETKQQMIEAQLQKLLSILEDTTLEEPPTKLQRTDTMEIKEDDIETPASTPEQVDTPRPTVTDLNQIKPGTGTDINVTINPTRKRKLNN